MGNKRSDVETGLYYNVTRYYNPEWGRWLNADDVSYLDPSSINGLNLFAYCLNNPIMMIDSNGMAPEWLKDVGRFLGGLAITAVATAVTVATFPLLLFPRAATIPQFGMTMMIYGGTLMASPFSSTVKSDMQLIGWNPFNSNADTAVQSQRISFYKGAAVFRHNGSGSMGLLGMVFLYRDSDGLHPDWLRHEYGHVVQGRVLGFLLFAGIVGIPSLIMAAINHPNYDFLYFERWADKWGGVSPDAPWYSWIR